VPFLSNRFSFVKVPAPGMRLRWSNAPFCGVPGSTVSIMSLADAAVHADETACSGANGTGN
jgi:hypothetical protein